MNKTNGYNRLCHTIEQCVTPITYEDIGQCSTLLMIAINEELRLKRCVDKITANNRGLQIVFVAQPSMEPVIKEWYGENYQTVVWRGRYTTDILDLLEKRIEITSIKGFLYFTEQPINMRDENFGQIAERLCSMNNIRIFSNTIGEDLYEYHNLVLYNQGMKVYNEINRLIDCYDAVGWEGDVMNEDWHFVPK